MSDLVTLVWFRQDLRTSDNHALAKAAKRGVAVPVYIWSPEEEGDWAPGGASRWWLHQSLADLQEQLHKLGSPLVIRSGNSLDCLQKLIKETNASAVYWNRRYEPSIIERDKKIKAALSNHGLDVQSFNGSLLFEPWEIETKQGNPYQVFTPFWKMCLTQEKDHDPIAKPKKLKSPNRKIESCRLEELQLEPTIQWDEGIRNYWQVGSKTALKKLRKFLQRAVVDYKEDRNRMDHLGTSEMSPYLHFGEISPREIWVETQAALATSPTIKKGADCYLSEIGWREFGYHLLYHLPDTTRQPLREKFLDFPWRKSKKDLERWQKGQTGVPIIDAAMRQLWTTGIMHNRARMIVASFLTKHLMMPWQEGAAWFWDTLVDADLASNTLGWQWTAGCGADAAPYFRVFNPVTQAKKFDPDGIYIRRWVPELAYLSPPDIFAPWDAKRETLVQANVDLGKTYPKPLIELSVGRQRALAAYETVRKT